MSRRKTTLDLAANIIHEVGDIVYLRTCPEQYKRIVPGVLIREENISYGLSLGDRETFHGIKEITTTRNILESI